MEGIGGAFAQEHPHPHPFPAEGPRPLHLVEEGLDLPQHVLIPLLPDDAVAVEVVQVHGHARRVQGQAAQKLEPGKGQGLGEPGEGIVLQLRVYQRIRRQQRPVGHRGHIEAEQILPGNRFRVGGQMDAVHRGLLLPGEGPQQAMPVPPLRRMDVGQGAHEAQPGLRADGVDRTLQLRGNLHQGPAAGVQPDPPVGMGLSRLEDAPNKVLPGHGMPGHLGIEGHVGLAEASAPHQGRVVVETEVVLHPEDMGTQGGIAGVELRQVVLPALVQRADAQLRRIALHVHHGTEGQLRAHFLAHIRVHDAVPVVHRQRNAVGPEHPLHVL